MLINILQLQPIVSIEQKGQKKSTENNPPELMETLNNQESKANGSALELLNTDVLYVIMTACSSLDDLSAFIHASPILYRSFLSSKSQVLIKVVANQLGPAIRDATLLVRTQRFTGDDHEAKVDDVVKDYRKCLQAVLPPAASLDATTVMQLAKTTRVIFHFVGLYGYFRFRYFRNHLDPAQEHKSMSLAERQRIALALIRFQLLVNFHCGTYFRPRNYPYFVNKVLSLFEPWEMEQISEMDCFLFGLCAALQMNEKIVTTPNGRAQLSVGLQYYIDHYHTDLGALYDKFREASTRLGDTLLDRLCEHDGVLGGEMNGAYVGFTWLAGSHRITPPPHEDPDLNVDNSYQASDCVSTHFEQPWAWKDALSGGTRRWGLDLVPDPVNEENTEEHREASKLLESWRWAGVVFWDRERVERLKTAKVLARCTTNWLSRWQIP